MSAATNGTVPTTDEKIASLTKTVEELAHQIGKTEDAAAIRKLHFQYGYYLDKCLYSQVVDLFADDGAASFHGGTWQGKEGVRRLFIGRFRKNFTEDKNGPIKGFLLDHIMLQDVVTVGDDRLSAKMRARTFMQAGRHVDYPLNDAARALPPRQWWEGGLYENLYSRKSVNDPWQIKLLNYHPLWHGDFTKGWSHTTPEWVPFPKVRYPEDPAGPDVLHSKEDTWLWPDTHTVPFHYSHPITGENVAEADLRAPTMEEYRASIGVVENGKH